MELTTRHTLPPRDVASFAELLAGLVRGRVPLPEVFRAIGAEAPSARFKKLMSEIERKVADGQPLPDALRASGAFPPLFMKLVEQGCQSNGLHAALLEAAREYAAQSRHRDDLWIRLIAPITAAVLLVVTVAGLVYANVIAALRSFVEVENKRLPWPTRWLFDLDNLLRNPLALAVAAGVFGIGVCALAWFWRKGNLRRRVEELGLRAPIFGSYLKSSTHARFCRQLGALVQSGVAVPQALELAAECMPLTRAQSAARAAAAKVAAGMTLSSALDADPFFARTLVYFVRGAEQDGELPRALQSLAEQYQSQSEIDAQKLNVTLCVLATLFAGLMVGWFAIAAIEPTMPGYDIYRIQEVLRKK